MRDLAASTQITLFVVGSLLLGGCRAATPPESAVEAGHHDDGIAWFDGTVDAAFARAKAERRPVFLYWGAVWCPPCYILQTKVFTRPEFLARVASTVPVYLDGDTERAQIWGEKLATAGYPTVIIFDADGREVMRLNSLISVEQYERALAAALDATRPIGELVATIAAGGVGELAPADLNLLAFYSWFQDEQTHLDLAGRRSLFEKLWRGTPAELRIERSRFLNLWIDTLTSSERGDPGTPAADSDDTLRARLADELIQLFADRELRNTNLEIVLYGAAKTSWLAPETGERRAALAAAWLAAARAVEDDEALTVGERIAGLFAEIELARLDDPEDAETPSPLPEELRQRIATTIRWASDSVTDEEELQGVMNTMAHVLNNSGMIDEAKALLAERTKETTAPYYFLGWQASLEEDTGNQEAAVKLYREAWQGARDSGSENGMTPLRWGATYVRKVTALKPAALEAIATDTATIVEDALKSPDAFSGGNWSRLKAVRSTIEEWQQDDPARASVLELLDSKLTAACAPLADEGPDSAGGRCRSLLAPAAG